jgi:hypothetical protein
MASSTKATTNDAFSKFKKRMNARSSSVKGNAHSNSSSAQTSGQRVNVQHIDYDKKVRLVLQVQQQSGNTSAPQSKQQLDTSLTTSQAGDDSVHVQYPLAR